MTKKAEFILILQGAPASGKDTQGRLLARRYRMSIFSSGEAMRSLMKKDPRAREALSKTLEQGKFAPAWIYEKLLDMYLMFLEKQGNLLLNGNPRLVSEARYLLGRLEKGGVRKVVCIYLHIPQKEVIRRSKLREKKQSRVDDEHTAARVKIHKFYMPKVLKYLKTRGIGIARVDS